MKALCPTCFGAGCVRCGLPPRSSKHVAAGRLGSVKAAHLRAHPVEPSSLPSNPPPGMTRERWVALLAEGARLDAIANRGAGPMRERTVPRTGVRPGKIGAENDSGPGGAETPRDPASPTKES